MFSFSNIPEAFISAPIVSRDLVCLWVLELPILKLLTRIVCFSLMQRVLVRLTYSLPGAAFTK